ncbi:BBSome-interacting protein 1 [Phlebotomus argentipes]|uniref:BBSome-interacting protein 1 n=1 Tax=Phlebotomus argentipes TaxID=94469 RepID=UPI002892D431|nr:BBSome-interacting protein 1 [Phlebotomus argentipes]
MSENTHKSTLPVKILLPASGKLFFQHKPDFVFCKPHLMPLKSITVEKLEKMQLEAQKLRCKTAQS